MKPEDFSGVAAGLLLEGPAREIPILDDIVAGPQWPTPLAPEALHGLAGEVVSIIAPHNEADPVALLMHLLVAFGSLVGRGPHFNVGGTRHHGNLNCINVGSTASRKGTAKDDTFFVIR